jgi:hypothetical protein
MSALTEPWMDDLDVQLSAAAVRVTTRLSARRRSRRIAGLAVAIALVLGTAALAETPFHPIASFQGLVGAQRPTNAGDGIFPPVRATMQGQPGALYAIGQARLMAVLPGGARLYAFPGRAGSLCLMYREPFDAAAVIGCRPDLAHSVPIAPFTLSGRDRATVVTGLARDDVRAISFTVGGATRTVAVHANTFWFSDPAAPQAPRSFVVHFADGSSAVYPRHPLAVSRAAPRSAPRPRTGR